MIPYKIFFDEKADKLRICLPEHLSLVEEYLEGQVRSELSKNLILDRIQRVVSGEEEVSEGTGNLYSSEIRRDYTRIYNSYVEEQLEAGIDTGEELESIIETKYFAELVTIWMDALNAYRQQRDSKK
ncbi:MULTISPECIES: hypothetical protein [Brevibacillus]|uniref:hypothetical protein n=1 Tax=Brevibacillus TaxID=55080 RepID=UPI000D104E9E|nr:MULTISPECIES: hypothetical protein [Brevibacillus]PSJ69595.1 hypothetical protein C7J99_09305 [Brevibacillus brevis]RED23127.1 hypothetical protein DES34_115101 [Brevibacillus brevis]TQK45698.1 hypothetical protein FB479_11387 [Brevibacillus sp. AG162]VEF87509.1 Uncharacterised protein [Brevibacillus brevis]GEC89612.1 hypothetical protein BBR01nite_19430 [Brevibacillus brevis]